MSQYFGIQRSNYFKVKNEEEFLEWADDLNLSVLHKNEDGEKSFAIYDVSGESGGWPNSLIDDFGGEEDEVDFKGELVSHLQDGAVAVLVEIGNEALEYFLGHAVALNSKGKSVVITLDDIYEAASHLGSTMTKARD